MICDLSFHSHFGRHSPFHQHFPCKNNHIKNHGFSVENAWLTCFAEVRKKILSSFRAILNKYYAKVPIYLSREIILLIRASLGRSSMMNPGREAEILTSSVSRRTWEPP